MIVQNLKSNYSHKIFDLRLSLPREFYLRTVTFWNIGNIPNKTDFTLLNPPLERNNFTKFGVKRLAIIIYDAFINSISTYMLPLQIVYVYTVTIVCLEISNAGVFSIWKTALQVQKSVLSSIDISYNLYLLCQNLLMQRIF